MKKKRLVALALCTAMAVSATGCNVKTKSDTTSAAAENQGPTEADPNADVEIGEVNLKLLYQSSDESVANVIRDELTKAGMNVEMSAAADGATFREQEGNGNFDIAISSWANPVGTPDYGCRGIWESTGDSNLLGINDPKLDELVNKAAGETPDVYVKTYGEAEKYVVEEMTYMTPLYIGLTGRPYSNLLKGESITNNQRWEKLDYVDESLRDTRPVVLTQTGSSITTWDPIRADDQSSGYTLDELYIHLLTLQPDWSVSTDSSLSYNYAISEDNKSYYFILRDDCGFARVDKDGKVYDSGVKVSGEDVVYSLNRAKDENSTAMHKTYSMYTNLDTVEIVTDAAELDSVKTVDGKTIREVLEADITPISKLAATRDEVDNAAGSYQVVRCNTTVPYPQILNCLTFHGAGIVDSEWVEKMNEGVDFANYDATKDRLYGDSVTTVEGATYDNQLSLSGNYVLTSMNDYQMNFVANPYLRTNDPECTKIKSLVNKFIADKDTALSALRSGDVDFCYSIPSTKYEVVEKDENLGLNKFPGIRVYMLAFNMHGNSIVSDSVDLRKAISSVINYNDISAVQAGNTIECYSPLGTCLDAGNKLSYQPGDTEKYLRAYFANKK
ncbi:MAG: ABC transporter substrate-binding protein [Lachnospiraceae bacterium]|nr:ABC transporter substrate-binding protein [Lachnospiraceae bacterium]